MDENILKKIKAPLFIIIILLAISFITLTPVIYMLILGAMIAYGIRPVANKIQSKVKFPSISIILAIIVVVIPLILLLVYLFSVIVGFALTFINANGANLSHFDLNQTVQLVINSLPPQIQATAHSYTSSLYDGINTLFKWALNYIIGLLKQIPEISLQLFVLLFSIYYFARDGDNLMEYFYTFVPDNKMSLFNRMIDEVQNVLKSIFYGHFLTAIIIGIMGAIGYGLLGYPYAIFLGVLTGFLQLIPIFGPWPIYSVLCIMDFFSGNYVRAIIVLLFGFVLSLSDMYIRPTLAGKYADIHSMILLLGFMAGPFVFGLVGFIIGPLILGITYAVIKAYKEEIEEFKSKEENEDNLVES